MHVYIFCLLFHSTEYSYCHYEQFYTNTKGSAIWWQAGQQLMPFQSAKSQGPCILFQCATVNIRYGTRCCKWLVVWAVCTVLLKMGACVLVTGDVFKTWCQNVTHWESFIIIIISIQPLGQFGQESEPSMALVHCILGKFLGVVCHCFPLCLNFQLSLPGACTSEMTWEILATKGGTMGEKGCPVILPTWRHYSRH